MKDKLNLLKNKFTNFYKSTYGMLITISWALLIICLIIKLFGGNWFELNAENSKFIQFCLYVDKHIWLKRSVACLVSIISTIPLMCLIYNKKDWKLKHIIIYLIVMIVKSIIGWYIPLLNTLIDLLFLILIPILITKNWKRPIIYNIIIMVLQLITIFIRNLSIDFNVQTTTIQGIIYQVDYYVMLILLFLYNFKGKEKK